MASLGEERRQSIGLVFGGLQLVQARLHLVVYPLDEAVGLRVVSCGWCVLSPKVGAEAVNKQDMNCIHRSEISCEGIPYLENWVFAISMATLGAVIFLMGMALN